MNTMDNGGETRYQKLGRVLAASGLARSAEVAMNNMVRHECEEADFKAFLSAYMTNIRNRKQIKVATRLILEFLPEVSKETREDLLVIELGMNSLLMEMNGVERVCARIRSLHKAGKVGSGKFPFLAIPEGKPKKG